ncbi:MAG: adenylate/guanylate cyclase domain-containing protein, partial [Rhodobacteraceae bacterium]|nr:adenylate/guanylate cyclase domain-containing protein [Paracoccaceae bacterium]
MFDQRRQLDDATSQLFLVAERRAEWLIGWLRLGISSTLAIVFTVAMTSATVEMTQMLKWQVIYALGTMGVYFLLGALALVIVWAGLFRAWMVWPSALGDCVFILGSTALAVGNTGLPGLYVYVFPTVWLIPIVLACGALRFNPPLQGAMAAVLGAGLVTLLFVQGITPDVTRSNEALGFLFGVPPNLMRTAMILVGAIVLMVASTRIRALLWASITEAEARGMLKRFLPEQLAQAKAQDLDELREGQQVQMAVAFVDIRGFTRMAEGMAARDLTAFLGRFRSVISARASACGGIVDKFIGDGALVVFPDGGPGAA